MLSYLITRYLLNSNFILSFPVLYKLSDHYAYHVTAKDEVETKRRRRIRLQDTDFSHFLFVDLPISYSSTFLAQDTRCPQDSENSNYNR
ncbi:hypothetical protein CW304_08995 [Bacillus sp. UFRGS-B20]|nr:hypothetical protein CW304_08995 [Bacillus sp. UFRGS-B20]